MVLQKGISKRTAFRQVAIVLAVVFGSTVVAQAQLLGKPGQRDIAVGATGQLSYDAQGNGVKQTANSSLGALFSFHSSYKWSRGFVLNYGYNRMSEDIEGTETNPYGDLNAPYSSGTANRHEFTAAYLVKGPKMFWGMRPFALAGGGALLYVPAAGFFTIYHHAQAENTQTQTLEDASYTSRLDVSSQTRATGLVGAGLDWDHDKHWGARLEYRALAFLAPSFQQSDFSSHAFTFSQMPTASIYFKF